MRGQAHQQLAILDEAVGSQVTSGDFSNEFGANSVNNVSFSVFSISIRCPHGIQSAFKNTRDESFLSFHAQPRCFLRDTRRTELLDKGMDMNDAEMTELEDLMEYPHTPKLATPPYLRLEYQSYQSPYLPTLRNVQASYARVVEYLRTEPYWEMVMVRIPHSSGFRHDPEYRSAENTGYRTAISMDMTIPQYRTAISMDNEAYAEWRTQAWYSHSMVWHCDRVARLREDAERVARLREDSGYRIPKDTDRHKRQRQT